MPRSKRGQCPKQHKTARKHNLFEAPKNLLNEIVTFTDVLDAQRPNESTTTERNFFFTLNGYNAYG